MTDIPSLARGRDCQIRVPMECLHSPESVVFCHVRLPDISGLGIKAPAWAGAFGCSRCHDIVDGRAGSWVMYPQNVRDLMLLEGTIRTMAILVSEGVIVVPEAGKRVAKLSKIVPRRLLTEAHAALQQSENK